MKTKIEVDHDFLDRIADNADGVSLLLTRALMLDEKQVWEKLQYYGIVRVTDDEPEVEVAPKSRPSPKSKTSKVISAETH